MHLTVHGESQPGGSKKAFVIPGKRHPVVADANPKAKGWKDQIAKACAEQYGGAFLEGPLEAEFHFYRPRPQSHFGTGRNEGVLKESAPKHPISAPDVDKLSRLVLDGLTGQLYRDDSRIVRKFVEKHYGEPARVEITVSQIGATLGERDFREAMQQIALVA